MARAKKSTKSKGKSRKKKGNVVSVDFTGVEGRVLVPEGDYRAKVDEVSKEVSQNDNEYLSWLFRTIDEDDKKLDDKPLYYNTSLQPQALWNLRNLLETLGVDIPDGVMALDLTELPGLELVLTVEHETFEGKKRARVVDFMPLEDEEDEEGEVEDDEAEDEDEDDEGGEEGITADEVKGMATAELKELAEEYELEIEWKKHRSVSKKRNAVIAALEEAELLED